MPSSTAVSSSSGREDVYKRQEVALANRIEATYTKDEILETYINRIFWGHTFLGIAAAARGYYDKERCV